MSKHKQSEILKVFFAVLLAFVVLGGINLITSIIYSPKYDLSVRGYSIPTDADTQNLQKIEVAAIEFGQLIKNADIKMGEKSFKKCAACHNAAVGAAAKVGPNLWNIIGRKKASTDGFVYSKAMQEKGGSWTYEDLYYFINAPKKFVAGTKMGFAGIKKPEELANIVAYLRSKSDIQIAPPAEDMKIIPRK
jgi:cytochrome c